MIRKTYKYKLYNTKRQKHLDRAIYVAGGIYNHCIALHKRYYKLFGKSLNVYALQKHLTKLKKRPRYSHWKHVPSQAIQDITMRIDESYKRFFAWTKKRNGTRVSPPNFKKRIKYKSYTLKQAGWKIVDNAIWLNGYKFRFHKSREIDGTIKTITVKRDSIGDFYICISLEIKSNPIKPMTGKIAGFDFGLKTFLTSDEETNIDKEMPQYYLANLTKLRRLSRNLSKKKKGSNNRKKAKRELAKLHITIEAQRKDFHFKLINDLLNEFDILCFETLNIKAMQMMWGLKIGDYGYAQFMMQLKAKAQEHKKQIINIDQWYPSSKTCSCCGHVIESLELKTREWTCPSCNTLRPRDQNAANNIKRVGASTLTGDLVRPVKAG